MKQHDPWSDSALSALFDEESDAVELAAQFSSSMPVSEAALEQWVAHQAVRDGLRNIPSSGSTAFLNGFRAKLAQDPVVKPVDVAGRLPAVANDASVLRWKMLAGFSSCLAAGALVWASWGAQSHGDAQLAQAMPSAVAPVSMFAAPYPKLAAEATWGFSEVIEAQELEASGGMLRDPALDDLLRAHGAVSSSQAAGFFRSATFNHDGL